MPRRANQVRCEDCISGVTDIDVMAERAVSALTEEQRSHLADVLRNVSDT